MNFFATLTALALTATQVAAKTVVIEVGHNGNSYFKPDYTKADIGDIVEFRFDSKEHSVVQGNWFTGCYPAAEGGFYSGRQKSPNAFQVTIKDTKPIMVYSSVGLECQVGMVAVINADGLQTLTSYRNKAKTSIKNTSPDKQFGGTLVTMPSDKSDAKSSGSKLMPIGGVFVALAALFF